ncbi:MAG: hypothetical protein Ct9H300mP19_10280 [Dehalococcoidia bacterium]|nr:MAG: hypothetical protein Ct9H300mP19_10280 [Dehalococcoidia bacterium]
MVKLSERQQMIMSFIEDFIDENDYPPTIRDIQNGCSISSTSVVAYNPEKLKEGGQLNRHSEVSRGFSLASVGPNSNKFKPSEIDSVAVPFLAQSPQAHHSRCQKMTLGPICLDQN